jgi:hypothetical protein
LEAHLLPSNGCKLPIDINLLVGGEDADFCERVHASVNEYQVRHMVTDKEGTKAGGWLGAWISEFQEQCWKE